MNGDRKYSRSVLFAHGAGREIGIFVWVGPAPGDSIRNFVGLEKTLETP